MPRTRREKAAAAAGSIGEMLHKKAATTSSGGVPMVHPGEEAADSSGEMPHKRAATTSSGGVPMVHPGEAAADSSGGVPMVYPGEAAAASSGEMLHKKAGTASSGGVPMVQPGWEATDSSGEMLDKKAAASLVGGVPMVHSGEEAGSSGGMMHKKAAASLVGGLPMVHSGEGAGSSGGMMREVAAASLVGGVPMVHSGEEAGSSGGMMREVAAAASSGGVLTVYPIEEAVSTGSSGAMPQKKATASSSGSAALVAINVTAQVSEEFTPEHRAKKARTASTLEIPQKHCTEDDADMSLSGGMLQKQSSKVEADTSLTGELVHEHPVKEAETAKNFQKSDGNEVVHVKLENEELQEAELLIQKLNHLGIGEHVSSDEFLGYFNGLPCRPRSINPTLELTDEELYKQMVRHALYRFKYYKHKLKEGKEDTFGLKDISEDDCDQELLEKHGFFRKLEKNWTIDWFFHPDYCMHASLNDYQRLVLRNYAGTEYIKWSEYHMFLNSPDTEEEYVKYSQELFKRLDWMEVYLNAYRRPSYKWGCISSRGAYQAMKIAATTFNKITASLAYLGYYECIQSMAYDRRWFKELDDVYFEIWQRVTQGMSFKAALKEVYELNIFPLRQLRMKAALEHEYTMEDMEGEFHTCTAAIPPGVKEDKAKELIAEAVIKLVDKPKSYEQYIRKKMEIARIVGILPPLEATV